jgi:DNA-binding MarR family transcriptional regulator
MRPEPLARLFELTARSLCDAPPHSRLRLLEWAVLRALAAHGRQLHSEASLTNYLGVTLPQVQGALGSLVRGGAVESAGDSPSETFKLTSAGKELLGQDPILAIVRALEGFEPNERECAGRVLERVADAVRAKRCP